MSASVASDRGRAVGTPSGLAASIQRHPVTAFFVLAFIGTWALYVPVLLSPRGLGIIKIPDGLVFAMFILSTYAGPFVGAWIVTRVIDGQAGVRQWFKRMLQWRVRWLWYVVVLVGYPVVFGLAATILEGRSAVEAAQLNAGSFIAGYLVTLVVGFFAPTLGEEAGWRGFALTRLQAARGPLMATLIVSVIHAVWHLPAYFVKGAITSTGEFDPTLFVANSLAIIASSFVWTWLFNNAAGSIFFATLVHAASNAMSGNLPAFLNLQDSNPWFAFVVSAIVAVLVVALTRGRLGYAGRGST
jgi:membrane protease YdiL (CAAX protease family)